MKKLIPLLLLMVMLTAGCDLAGINLTTTTQSATINSFNASPASITAGESSTLNWGVTGATSVSIDQGIGNVALTGSRAVMPGTTTVYTLTATNAAGVSVTATTQIIVSGASTPSPTLPVPRQLRFAVTGVTASADPPFFSGACPTTVNFYATITVNGPGTVTYNWERSDGALSRIASLTFGGPGSQTANTSWPLDETGSYWKRVHVYTPNEIISNQASFTLSCASAPGGIWAGTWETTYGTMILSQSGNQVTGSYEHSNGIITGTVSGNILYGTWSEAPTYTAPDYAGDVQLTISPNGFTFTGGWRNGSSGSWSMNWNGTKIF